MKTKKDGGEGDGNLQKGNCEAPRSTSVLCMTGARLFLSQQESMAGFWWCLCWNPGSVSEGWPPLWRGGYSFLCWVHPARFLLHHPGNAVSPKDVPLQKGLPGGLGGLRGPTPLSSCTATWARRPSRWTMALFPKWLSSCLRKDSLGLDRAGVPG